MELTLDIKTKGNLTDSEKELLAANIWALLNEVRPDLVEEGIKTEIQSVEVSQKQRNQ